MKKIILSTILCLFFSISFAQKRTLFLVGDSTMANKENPTKNPEHGWGQLLPELMNSDLEIPLDLKILNCSIKRREKSLSTL